MFQLSYMTTSIVNVSRFIRSEDGIYPNVGTGDILKVSDELVEKIWEKMMSKKPIIFCEYCESAMTYDSPTCSQCGAPGGRAKR